MTLEDAIRDLLEAWRVGVPSRIGVSTDTATILDDIFGRTRAPRSAWQSANGAKLSVGTRRLEPALARNMTVSVQAVMEQAALQQLRQLGLSTSAIDVGGTMRRAAEKMATLVTNELERNTMRGVVQAIGLARGKSVSVTTTVQRLIGIPPQQIRQAFEDGTTTDAVIRTIQQTVQHDAEQWGRYLAVTEADTQGYRIRKRWVSMLDGRERPAHRRLHGAERSLTGVFMDQGIARQVPGGWNCRCHLDYIKVATTIRMRKTFTPEPPMSHRNLLLSVAQGQTASHVIVSDLQGDAPTRTLLLAHAESLGGRVVKDFADGVYVAAGLEAPMVFLGTDPTIDQMLEASRSRLLVTKGDDASGALTCLCTVYVREQPSGKVMISSYPRYEFYQDNPSLTPPTSETVYVDRQGEWNDLEIALLPDGEYFLRNDDLFYIGPPDMDWEARERTVMSLIASPGELMPVGKGDGASCAPGTKMGTRKKKKPMPYGKDDMKKSADRSALDRQFVFVRRALASRPLLREARLEKSYTGCASCTYYTGVGKCFAYPDNIPGLYRDATVRHEVPHPGTGGFVYRRIDKNDIVTKALDMGIGPHTAAWFASIVQTQVVKQATLPNERIVVGFFYPNAHPDGTLKVDRQKDVVTMDTLTKTMADFMAGPRILGMDHLRYGSEEAPVPVGVVLEGVVLTKAMRTTLGLPGTMDLGAVGAAYVERDDAWASVQRGERLSFSIGGKAHRIPIAD